MRKLYVLLALFCFLISGIHAQTISLTGGTYSQDFNTLSNTAGSTTNNLTITGWFLTESGGGARDNEQYAVDAGASNTGDTYSYGSAASTDRAIGGLQSGTLIPVFGAAFTNNTGTTITSLSISYTGEEWRLGTAARTDQLTFEYSTNATDLVTGTWTNTAALNFITPATATAGAKDGNAAANRTALNGAITGLNIPAGATFWIRWTDLNASGADDGLAVDDFSITPNAAVTPNLSINDVSLAESNSGTVTFSFTVSLSSPAGPGGVSFDISTADNTATVANNDYVSNSLTGQIIPAGSSSYTFTVTVNGDATTEPNETFFVNITNVTGANVVDGQGTGTILNDDVGLTPIHDIQGNGNSSPVNGTSVTTSGIVTGRRSNGFFIQEPDATIDADPLTSEGIFVFTSSAPPAAAVVGNLVQVTGTVTEFIPSTDPNSPPQTELTSPSVVLISSGNPLPAPVTLTAANTNPAGSLQQLERFESMRVTAASFTVVAPTDGTVTEASATSVSNGLFYVVITGVARPFREAGIRVPDPLPGGAPATVTRWDANPEIIGVNSTVLGAPALDVATDAVLSGLTGVLDFRNRFYTIDVEPATVPVVSNNNRTFTAVPAPAANELTVASFNLERFYDNVNDPGGDVVLTTAALNNRLNKASLAIRNVLQTPDVLGVIEVENLSVLQALANKINNDAVAASQPNPNYVPYLVEGNDVGLIDVGFLVKPGRVTVNSVTQFGAATTYINPNNGLPETLNDRPPLVLDGTFTGTSCVSANTFKVIVNHLRSLNGMDDAIDGNRVRTKRQQQAEFLANLIQSFQTADPNVKIVSVGDYNAFEFSDGYVDLIGTIKGTPAPAANVVLASADLVNPDLVDLIDTHTPAEKYSYSFDGSAQTLDHILVNANMNARLSRFAVARLDADFPEVYRNDANRPERISDHDAPVAYFLFAASTPVISNVTVTQPSCTVATGSIVITATGSGTLEYSVDNGASWQASNSFAGLTPGSYNIQVRDQSSPLCVTSYTANPVVLSPVTVQNLPLIQGFESTTFPPAGYTLSNPDNGITWARTTVAAKTGVASMRLDAYNYNTTGAVDLLTTPVLNTASVKAIRVKFDVAYAIYSPTFRDTLAVVYSTDCGVTWQPTGYIKSQTDLATNGGGGVTSLFTPTASQWRTDSVDISLCNQYAQVLVGFRFINRNGNDCYIDDIRIDTFTREITQVLVAEPNCNQVNSGRIQITANGSGALEYSIDNGASWQSSAAFTGLVAGSYFIKVREQAAPSCTTVYAGNPVVLTPPVPQSLPLTEGFESALFPPSRYTLLNPDLSFTWERTTVAAKSGVASMLLNAYNYVSAGAVDILATPQLSTSTVQTLRVKFDLAYAILNPIFRDTLSIVYSTDCGATWLPTGYVKTQADLATNGGAAVTSSFTPNASQWRTDSVDINLCSQYAQVLVGFRFVNRVGNNCYIDNLNISGLADQTPPAITCPAPVTVSCAGAVPAPDISAVTATDNCPVAPVITHQGDVISAQTCANRYTITRTYRATDAAGNFSECTQIITVNDQTPPVMTCPAPVTVGCASAVPVPNINSVTGVSDNCGGTVTVTFVGDVISAQTCVNRYTITRTYRATDACGNFAECTQIITVNDQTPPVLTCPAPVTVCGPASVPAPDINSVTGVSDNCGGVVTVTFVSDVNNCPACVNTPYTITRTYRATDACGNFTECTQLITVNPVPTVNSLSNLTLCNGAASGAINFSGAVTGTVYNWTNSNTAIGLGASGTGNIPSFNAVNTGTTSVTATITVTPVFTNNSVTCTGTPRTFTITVNPAPTVNAVSNQTVCNGSAFSAVTFSGAVSGTVFNWTNNTTSIGLGASGSGNIPAFNGTNTGTAPVTATITVTPAYTNAGVTCTGTPVTFTLTVNPTPTVNAVTNRAVCNGATVASIAFTSPVTGVVFNWTRTNQAIGLAATSGTGNIPAFTATNSGSIPLVSTFTVTATYTNNSVSCTSAPVTFTVTVNPLPTVSLVLPFDTLYQNPSVVQLTGGTPAGGVFTGAGVSSQGLLNPAALSMGNYTVQYTYTDPNGCSGSATDNYTVIARTTRITVYPVPTNGHVNVVVTPDMVGSTMEVLDELGHKLTQYKLAGRLNTYYFPWAAGIYNLVFRVGQERIVKQILIAH